MATATRQVEASSGAGGPVRPARSRLRLLFCTDNLGVGGTELNAVRTAERLVALGVDLQVALLGSDGPLHERYAALDVPVHPFPIDSLYGTSAVRQGRAFAAFCRAGGVDVLHCHDAYSNVFGSIWGRAARVPGIIVSRRWWATHNNAKLRIANRLAYRLASRVLANSASVGASLVRDEGVAQRRVVVVPNFVEPEAFDPPSAGARAALRGAFGLPASGRVAGVVARLDPVKDHATSSVPSRCSARDSPTCISPSSATAPAASRSRHSRPSSGQPAGSTLPACGPTGPTRTTSSTCRH